MPKNEEILKLSHIGIDEWDRPVYKDQHGKLWVDINLGDSEVPSLYSVVGNCIDGEPLSPIHREHVFLNQFKRSKKAFEYMMLNRLQIDCETHLSADCHPSCRIKPENIEGVIQEMKDLWNQFTDDEKPQWITWEQILEFERQLLP